MSLQANFLWVLDSIYPEKNDSQEYQSKVSSVVQTAPPSPWPSYRCQYWESSSLRFHKLSWTGKWTAISLRRLSAWRFLLFFQKYFFFLRISYMSTIKHNIHHFISPLHILSSIFHLPFFFWFVFCYDIQLVLPLSSWRKASPGA